MKPYRSSVSQVSTYELCPRKWAWGYIDKIEGKPNKYAELGTLVHDLLEDWLKTGKVPPADKPGLIASSMLPHLPPPQAVQKSNVEKELNIVLGGITFLGYADLWLPDHPEGPTIYDHKTTSNFMWALQPHTAHDDIQATLYAAWAMLVTRKDPVRVQWTYGLTTGKAKVQLCQAELNSKQISPRLLKTVQSAKEMKLLYESGLRARQIPYDAAGCDAYGGCGYKELCNLSPQDRMRSVMSQGTAREDFIAKLKAKQSAPVAEAQDKNGRKSPGRTALPETEEDDPPPPRRGKAPLPAAEVDDDPPPPRRGKAPLPAAEVDDDPPPPRRGKAPLPAAEVDDDPPPPRRGKAPLPAAEVDDDPPPPRRGKAPLPAAEVDDDPPPPRRGKAPLPAAEVDDDPPPPRRGKAPLPAAEVDDDPPPPRRGKPVWAVPEGVAHWPAAEADDDDPPSPRRGKAPPPAAEVDDDPPPPRRGKAPPPAAEYDQDDDLPPDAQPTPEPTPKRGRGRPRKTAGSGTETPVAVPTEGWTLYLDCAPVKGNYTLEDGAERIQHAMLSVKKEIGTPHYQFSVQGRGLLSMTLSKDLAENPPKTGIVLNSASTEARDCLQAFLAEATNVIKG